jgi:hypothetical protein
MNSRNGDRGSLDGHPSADQLLNRPKRPTAELFGYGVGACWIFIDHANQFDDVQFAGKLVVNAGVITSKGAYADNGNGNETWIGQWELRKGFQI